LIAALYNLLVSLHQIILLFANTACKSGSVLRYYAVSVQSSRDYNCRNRTLSSIAVNHVGKRQASHALMENDRLCFIELRNNRNRGTTSKRSFLFFVQIIPSCHAVRMNAPHAYRLSFQPFQSIFTRTVPAYSRARLPLSQSERALAYDMDCSEIMKKTFMPFPTESASLSSSYLSFLDCNASCRLFIKSNRVFVIKNW